MCVALCLATIPRCSCGFQCLAMAWPGFAEMRRSVRPLTALLLVATAQMTGAQPSRCESAAHRQFDFWIGEWEVNDARGRRLGTNRIEAILGGCVLAESWEGSSGSRGRSLNVYDPGDNKWHQSW